MTKLNGLQKFVGLLGAVLVAFMFMSFPATTTTKDPKTTAEVQVTDYKATAIRVLGVTFATSALIVFLGIKPQPEKITKAKNTKKRRR